MDVSKVVAVAHESAAHAKELRESIADHRALLDEPPDSDLHEHLAVLEELARMHDELAERAADIALKQVDSSRPAIARPCGFRR